MIMAMRCVSTVLTVILSLNAISLFVYPSAIKRTSSRCLGVSAACSGVGFEQCLGYPLRDERLMRSEGANGRKQVSTCISL